MKIEEIVLAAGDILKKRYFEKTTHSTKERYHLLSEVDIELNDFITRRLHKLFPDHSIFSEEEQEIKKSEGERLIVDPIDGTTNFITGNPYFAISIAREENGRVVEGHVYNPVSCEYFFASEEGKSSFLNGQRISPSETTKISDSIVAFGFSANMKVIINYYSKWSSVFEDCKKGVAWVAPALSICNVARGRIEAFIDSGCSMQGQAAASLVLRNAGGKLYDINLSEYDHGKKGGIFTNGHLDINLRAIYKSEKNDPQQPG